MNDKTMRRREFFTRSANVATGVVTSITAASLWTPPAPLLAQIGTSPEPLPPIEDSRVKALVQRALDASRSAGATYADVRLTHQYHRSVGAGKRVGDTEAMTVGVRALVDGYWGFASGPVWSPDEMVRLGQEATHQAKTNALGKPRPCTLAPTPVIQDGQWTTPVRIDPFSLHPSAIHDIIEGISLYAVRRPDNIMIPGWTVTSDKLDKAFGSSEGSYYTQRQYMTSGVYRVRYTAPDGRNGERYVEGLRPASVGFELFDEPQLRQSVDTVIEEIKADLALPVRPVDVGRYDVVLDAQSVANFLDGTIGVATELDRALGYEANATGTSYLNEPFDMLGTLQLGSPLLTVTMNRNEPGGAATVQWDDEGVPTRSVTLVKEGILNEFQTTRESAMWVHDEAPQPWDARSTGSSYAPSAMDCPLTRTGNLVLQPSSTNHTVDDLIEDMNKGLFFRGFNVALDFQQSSGFAKGSTYEVRNGKKVALLSGAGILFKASEFWKKLTVLGGTSSTYRSVSGDDKGQPSQDSIRSVTAVPAIFTQQSVIDPERKA